MAIEVKVRALQGIPGLKKNRGDVFDVTAQDARDLVRAGRAEMVGAEKPAAAKPAAEKPAGK